jgi:putative ABC transport system ATP-binding protein
MARSVMHRSALHPETGDDPVIRLENLNRRYRMGAEFIDALDSVDLSVGRGDYLAIMGPSGSGKSTLMNIIGCLDTATSGAYWLNGKSVSDMNEKQLARIRNTEIGFVFQTFNLLPRMTALANVEVPLIYAGTKRRERDRRAKETLETVGLGDRMLHRPSEMSGGQRQRVAIARALVTNPSIVLADEPTGNLDSSTGREIMTLFDRLHADGNTLIVVTHEAQVAQHARRVIHLSDGNIVRDEKQGVNP